MSKKRPSQSTNQVTQEPHEAPTEVQCDYCAAPVAVSKAREYSIWKACETCAEAMVKAGQLPERA